MHEDKLKYDVDKDVDKDVKSKVLFNNFLDIFHYYGMFDRQSNYIEDNEIFYNKMLNHSEYLLTFTNMKLQGLDKLMTENIWIETKNGDEELNIYFKTADDYLYDYLEKNPPTNMDLIHKAIENCKQKITYD